MKTALSAFAVAALLCLLPGCATTGITPQIQPGTDFSRYHTFAVLPLGQGTQGNLPAAGKELFDAAVKEASACLTRKGLRPASESQADLLVDISGNAVAVPDSYLHRDVYTRQGSVGVYYLNSAFPQIQTQCNAVVELVDRASSKVVWRAQQQDTLLSQPSTGSVAAMIREILSAYPPK